MKNKKMLNFITKQVLIASTYTVLSLVFYFLTYELVQFRIAEVLLILVYFNPYNAIGIIIGTIITNAMSPFGMIDVLVGTSATIVSILFMLILKRNKIISLLSPIIVNGIFIGLLLNILLETPLYLSISSVMLGEAVVIYFLALPVYLYLKKREDFIKIIS